MRPSAALKRPVLHYTTAGRGCHQRDGIIILHGDVVAARALDPNSICDVAPTLLWAMGAGIPTGGDGKLVLEAFEQSFAAMQPVTEVDPDFAPLDPMSQPESAEINRRLRELGYI